jgi:hypothetical protein
VTESYYLTPQEYATIFHAPSNISQTEEDTVEMKNALGSFDLDEDEHDFLNKKSKSELISKVSEI